MDALTDHSLMLKVKKGDLDRLNLIYQRYSRRLYGFFFRMTGEGATSEDLVQNVFMRMLKYRHTYSESGSFEPWIFHLARNVHHDHYRKAKRYHFDEDMQSWEGKMADHKNQESVSMHEDEMRNLRRAISSLSEDKRELIELTRYQEMKYSEVANLLGISESAVKVRVHRVLKELKENYLKLDA